MAKKKKNQTSPLKDTAPSTRDIVFSSAMMLPERGLVSGSTLGGSTHGKMDQSGTSLENVMSKVDTDWSAGAENEDPWASCDKNESEVFWGVSTGTQEDKKDDKPSEHCQETCGVEADSADKTDSPQAGDRQIHEQSTTPLKPGENPNKDLFRGRVSDEMMECGDVIKVVEADSDNNVQDITLPGQNTEPNVEENDDDTEREVLEQMGESTENVDDIVDEGGDDEDGDEPECDAEFHPECLEHDDDADLYVVDDTDESDTEMQEGEKKLQWAAVRKKNPSKLDECLQISFEEVGMLKQCYTIHVQR